MDHNQRRLNRQTAYAHGWIRLDDPGGSDLCDDAQFLPAPASGDDLSDQPQRE